MRIPRIYTEQNLTSGCSVELETQASHHLIKVLRLTNGAPLTLFNNAGGEFEAIIEAQSKKMVTVTIGDHHLDDKQSPLAVHLGIAISKGDRMDWVMQKATELGAQSITPIYSERTEVKLKPEREAKKLKHWQQIIISACEQSARNRLPALHAPTQLHVWSSAIEADKKFVLHHRTDEQLNPNESVASVALLIGPEGGLSADEIKGAESQDFNALSLGPRVLRTETAPLAALSILQFIWGDF